MLRARMPMGRVLKMHKAPRPPDDAERLANLRMYNILDSAAERAFDDITLLASRLCQTPISIITLVDEERQWFKSHTGTELSQTDRDSSFCAHAIAGDEPFVISDALEDERFRDNPLVTGDPHVRFYAGMPLISAEGFALGALCVIDRVPRSISAEQLEALQSLGRQVVNLLELRRVTAASRAAEAFARSTVDALSAHIAILDDQGKIIAVNRAWQDYGAKNPPSPSNFAVGANYLAVCEAAIGPCSKDSLAMASGIRAVLRREKDEFTLEYPCHSPTEASWFVARVSHFSGTGPNRVVVAHENVTQRRLAEERLRHLSLHDVLTGLPNRVLFADRVEQALQRLKRDSTRHFAVLCIDLDRFKVVNDSMGHAAGDALLKTISKRLQACLRSSDSLTFEMSVKTAEEAPDGAIIGHTVSRMGGDEFTLVLDGLKHPNDAAIVAGRLLGAIYQTIEVNGRELRTTASIGIVNGSVSYNSAQELLRDADAAMYRAKTLGKARFVVFDSTMHAAAVLRMGLESDLRQALERGELLLHYQPIISLSTRELKGFEALVRWNRPSENGDGGLVSPGDFIPVAEDTGLILPLGQWVLKEACRQLAAWKRDHASAAKLTMSVNVSGKQLADDCFALHLRNVLEETKLDPSSIRLEITESILMNDSEGTMDRLSLLKMTGVLLSMDDFGTGYSSLSCLHQFPIDVLKIDRSFVQNLEGRRHSAAIVHAVVDLAHHMGMEVVAEGIEAIEHVAFLQALNCDLGQGYLFSKPLSAKDAERFLTQSRALSQAS
jgi:predicted signal transduction protein with EAL and GGDEF domain/PAS domain-containing protein